MEAGSTTAPLLEMTGIRKAFPGVRALQDVSLTLQRGEVLALLGENGAGKSTLIKILGGAHQPDGGEIRLEGMRMEFANPIQAQHAGISVIYQEFNLIPGLTVRDNLFLGRDKTTRFGVLRAKEEIAHAEEIFRRIGISIPLDAICQDLTVAQQQLVEIGKALALNARIMVMDEPTAALTHQEVDCLFEIIAGLKKEGLGIIYISHRLDEIARVADRISILRDGHHVETGPVQSFTRERLIERMVGRSLDQEFPKKAANLGKVRLRVRNLQRGQAVRGVSFEARAGEIVGFTGLVGAGRTETMRLLFGADQADNGTVELDGQLLSIRSPRDAIRAGLCLLTEDRKEQGLVLAHSVRENFSLPNLTHLSRRGVIDGDKERAAFAGYQESLRIKAPSPEQPAQFLSGGNQQKVVLAKWLERNAEVLIFDEPTRGIDVGAKYEIYQLMNRLAEAGKVILMVSSELPEVLGMSDRILVMREGRIVGEITDVGRTTQEQVIRLAMGES